jgi:hypothetical protein
LAQYTLQLRSYVESGGKVFDFEYPLFDPAYKSVLEEKFINHFYFREIGFETIGQFKWFLKDKFNRIMPLYNQQYGANEVFKTYDPYKNKDFTIEQTRTNATDSQTDTTANSSGTSHGTGSSTSNGTSKFSDTPQSLNDGKDYLTTLTKNDGTDTSTSDGNTTEEATGSATGKITSTEEYTQHLHGHDGMKYPTDILMGLRESFINIDQMIIDECYDLFMNIY